jgi:lipopolysaccharide export system protein LptA
MSVIKQKKWLLLGLTLWAILMGLLIWAVKKASPPPSSSIRQPLIEIRGSHINGYENDKLLWTWTFDLIKAPYSKFSFVAEDAYNGQFFSPQQKLILTNLKAKHVNIQSLVQEIRTSGYAEGDICASPNIRFRGQNLIFFGQTQEAVFQDGFTLTQAKYVLTTSSQARFKSNDQTLTIAGPYVLVSPTLNISANRLTSDFKSKRSHFEDKVVLKKPALSFSSSQDKRNILWLSKAYTLTCTAMEHQAGTENQQIWLTGPITLTEGQKRITAERGSYTFSTQLFELSGNVIMNFPNLGWIFPKSPENFANADIKHALQSPTEIRCDILILDRSKNTLTFKGHVVVKQKNLDLTCSEFIYNDTNHTVDLNGNVTLIRKGKGKASGQTIRFNLDTEAFSAKKNIYSQFRLPLSNP